MHDIPNIIVPEWYRDAKMNGDAEHVLKEKIHQFLLAALRRCKDASVENTDAVDEAIITLTYDMYEHALSKGQHA